MPLVRYRDVATAIEWLTEAFGFERRDVVLGDGGEILYAQLALGTARITLEPAPAEADEGAGANQSCYIIVPDADAHYARACAAGANIDFVIHDFGQGGRGYSSRDCEGHVWSFGTYDPWQSEKQAQPEPTAPALSSPRKAVRWALVSGMAACVLTSAVAATIMGTQGPPAVTAATPDPNSDAALREEIARAVREAEVQVSTERAARIAAESAADKMRSELDNERQAKETAEHTATQLQSLMAQRALQSQEAVPEELAEERRARATAELSATEAKARLDREQAALAALKQEISGLNEKLQHEQEARAAAERAQSDANAALERASAHEAAQALADMKVELAREREAREVDKRARAAALDEVARERAENNQASRTIGQLRRQLARTQAAASAAADTGMVASPEESATPKGGTAAKAADPPYNGPLSPF